MLQFHETNTPPVESGHEREVVSQTAHTVRSVVAVVVPQTSRACVQSYNAGLHARAALTVSTARDAGSSMPAQSLGLSSRSSHGSYSS